jgi:hypothetical protein
MALADASPLGRPDRPRLSWPRRLLGGMLIAVAATAVLLVGALMLGSSFGLLEIQPSDNLSMTPGPPTPPTRRISRGGRQYLDVSFGYLAGYACSVPEELQERPDEAAAWLRQRIPPDVQALDGQRVALAGFMVPVAGDGERAERFMLLATQMGCCFGITPPLNWWIDVAMANGRKARIARDVSITVYGTLRVGPFVDHGAIISLYRIEADRVAGPWLFGS